MNAHVATFDGIPLGSVPANAIGPVSAAMALEADPAAVWIRQGTAEHRRAGLAFFLAGFATFSLIYCVQPLLPLFAASYGVKSGGKLACTLADHEPGCHFHRTGGRILAGAGPPLADVLVHGACRDLRFGHGVRSKLARAPCRARG